MIKSYVINIKEMDDIEFALEELNEQMAEISLLKNSIGIVSLNWDYISSGIYEAVANALPFQLAGGTLLSVATKDEIGIFVFSVMIFTSDECEFSCAVSDAIPNEGNVDQITQNCYKKALAGLADKAKLAFLFAPLNPNHYAEKYVAAMSVIDESTPIFGTLTIAEVDNQFGGGKTLLGNECFDDKLVVVVISGDIEPQFYIGSVSDESIIMPNVGVITESNDNFVTKINNMPIENFFERIGYDPGVLNKGAQTTGFIMHEKNEEGEVVSSKVSGILSLKDGVGAFMGNIPEGTVMSVMTTTKEDIMKTAQATINELKKNHSEGTVLLYSCAGRMFCLMNEPMKEHEFLRDELSGDYSFMVAGSGGEICPTYVSNDKAYNRGHGHSLVICVI
ncbi:MAG: FIST C-terminal domain-containing protein [Lachnospiraceae bacterium]|nr:FIST C-terminal domain-containing protein [Lachnospiraceae bacterium]